VQSWRGDTVEVFGTVICRLGLVWAVAPFEPEAEPLTGGEGGLSILEFLVLYLVFSEWNDKGRTRWRGDFRVSWRCDRNLL